MEAKTTHLHSALSTMGNLIRESFYKLVVIAVAIFVVNFFHLVRFDYPQVVDVGDWIEASKTTSTTRRGGPLPRYRPLPQRHKGTRVLQGDYIYYKDLRKSWDASPVVLESQKLVFFTIPKVGCTVWKQLFRRMMGENDWQSQDESKGLPHNPLTNGLKYLYDYDVDRATEIMTSPQWTRAIMIRDPKERFLSAFLDKAVRNDHTHIISRCCPDHSCVEHAQTITGFLQLVQRCDDDHWRGQNNRIDEKFWGYVTDVLHVETAAKDTQSLLEKVGAWTEFGATGWGPNSDSAIFEQKDGGGGHSNYAKWQAWTWYTPNSEAAVVRQYQADYDNRLFQFDGEQCLTCTLTAEAE